MIQLGAFHTLRVSEATSFGMRLGDGSVALPREQVPDDCHVGDTLEVFVYQDSGGRIVAATKTPKGGLGDFVFLEVVDRSEHGVFMDWGMEKDLFVPRREQVVPMSVGQSHVVVITCDKQQRVMGSSRIRDFMDGDVGEAREQDKVEVLAYEVHERGMKVIVEGRWEGLIYNDDLYGQVHIGARLEGRVAKVREDAKLDIQIRPRGVAAMSSDRDVLLEALRANGGFLPLHDKSAPDAIQSELHMSKKAFKRAVGNLLRANEVRLEPGGIRLVDA